MVLIKRVFSKKTTFCILQGFLLGKTVFPINYRWENLGRIKFFVGFSECSRSYLTIAKRCVIVGTLVSPLTLTYQPPLKL